MNWYWRKLSDKLDLASLVRSLNTRFLALEHALALGEKIVAFRDGDTTPSVGGGSRFRTANTTGTTISAFRDGKIGQQVVVNIDDANTTIDFTGTTLKGNGGADWTPGDGDFMVCTFDGTNWRCQVTEV